MNGFVKDVRLLLEMCQWSEDIFLPDFLWKKKENMEWEKKFGFDFLTFWMD